MDKLHSLYSDNKYRIILNVNNAIISNLRLEDLLRNIADNLEQILEFEVGVDKISKYFESLIGQNQLSY